MSRKKKKTGGGRKEEVGLGWCGLGGFGARPAQERNRKGKKNRNIKEYDLNSPK